MGRIGARGVVGCSGARPTFQGALNKGIAG